MASTAKYFSVYRISLINYISDKKGMGAFKFGGRWAPKGYHVIYTSSSRSLAFCEFMANNNIAYLPEDLSIVEIKIPIKLKFLTVEEKFLSKEWRESLSNECKKIGERWILKSKTCILKVPSVVISGEFNYLINPSYKSFNSIQFLKAKTFLPDERIISQLRNK